MLFFWILLIYFAVDWLLLNSINKRVIHTQNVTDIVYIVKLLKLFCCFLLFSTFQFFFNEYGVLSYFFSFARIYFIYFFFLYNIVLVLPYINMNLPWVYTCSPSWTLLPPPSHPIPLGHPSAPAPSILNHASNLDWWFVSHMILYMFQCHSPKSSHPRPLPQNSKDCSIHLCLFCCPVYRVIVTIFLNSIFLH